MSTELDLSNVYTKTAMERIVSLPARDINTMIDVNLLNTLRNDVEGKCNREGYVKKGSIEITDHGTFNTEVIRFNGNIRVAVKFTARVANPSKGTIIECRINSYNKFGIGAISGPLNVVIPLDDKTKDKKFNVGQILKVKIVTADINLNDDQIDVYATFVDEDTSKIIDDAELADYTDLEEEDDEEETDLGEEGEEDDDDIILKEGDIKDTDDEVDFEEEEDDEEEDDEDEDLTPEKEPGAESGEESGAELEAT